ncbi:MAG TPA: PIN domain-containing protein [Bryobacteraceae bacterium]|nr:PIN domain-containing protein [Bryobacteraceae bacterium]
MRDQFSLLLDTNIVLDVLLDRNPHAVPSGALWGRIESGEARGLLAAHAVTTIHCLLRQQLKEPHAKRAVASLLSIFGIAPVNEKVLSDALLSNPVDYEDAVTAAAALHAGCDYIVTRDPRGYRGSTVTVVTPDAASALIARIRH